LSSLITRPIVCLNAYDIIILFLTFNKKKYFLNLKLPFKKTELLDGEYFKKESGQKDAQTGTKSEDNDMKSNQSMNSLDFKNFVSQGKFVFN